MSKVVKAVESTEQLAEQIKETEEWSLLKTLAQAEATVDDLDLEDEITPNKGSVWLAKIIEFMVRNNYKATEGQLIGLHPNPRPDATQYNLKNSLASVRSKGRKRGDAHIALIGSMYHLKWFKWDNSMYVIRNGQLLKRA